MPISVGPDSFHADVGLIIGLIWIGAGKRYQLSIGRQEQGAGDDSCRKLADLFSQLHVIHPNGACVVFADGNPVSGFTFTNNIVPDNSWAVMGTNASPGNGTISAFYPGSTFSRNVFIAGNSSTYPADNFYPATVDWVQSIMLRALQIIHLGIEGLKARS